MDTQETQDPRALLGYKASWRRIAKHLNLRDIAPDLGTTSVSLSKFEKGDFSQLTREQVIGYLDLLEMSDQAEAFVALLPEPQEA
jgi:hypothetical protein